MAHPGYSVGGPAYSVSSPAHSVSSPACSGVYRHHPGLKSVAGPCVIRGSVTAMHKITQSSRTTTDHPGYLVRGRQAPDPGKCDCGVKVRFFPIFISCLQHPEGEDLGHSRGPAEKQTAFVELATAVESPTECEQHDDASSCPE